MTILLIAFCLLPSLFGFVEPIFPFTDNPFFQNPLFNKPIEYVNNNGDGSTQMQNNGGRGTQMQNNGGGGTQMQVPQYYETNYKGAWEIAVTNQGVSGMHAVLMPNNKVIMYDATSQGPSGLRLKEKRENCRKALDGRIDCWAHSIEYDIVTGAIRPLKMNTNGWCSSGSLDANGILVSSGGWNDGGRAVRYFSPCQNCEWNDKNITHFSGQRWYSTQVILPNGEFIIVGGRRMFSYEYIPKEGQTQTKSFPLLLLDETTDQDENNLYPFVYLSTDGNLFIFANSRSILLNYKTNTVVREFPQLADGSRNYPPSAMSALLPIKLRGKNAPKNIQAEVIVCGGSAKTSFSQGEKKNYLPAIASCGRLVITDPNSQWKMEQMPSPRVMGDMLILPTGDLLFINGAKKGSAGWGCAETPNYVPEIYKPKNPVGKRFVQMTAATIPRMYHSSSVLLPDGKVLISGSNTNEIYLYKNVPYPTELRMEKFSPHYLDPTLAKHRPEISEGTSQKKLVYGKRFTVQFKLPDLKRTMDDIEVRMYRPPFTTHGYSMDQRQLILSLREVREVTNGFYRVTARSPQSNVVAPPGYYLLFVVHRGAPSTGMWVQI